jgi:hypothetical protein
MGNVIIGAELQVVLSANCQHDEKEGEFMGVERCGAAGLVLEVAGLDLDVSRVDLINDLIERSTCHDLVAAGSVSLSGTIDADADAQAEVT